MKVEEDGKKPFPIFLGGGVFFVFFVGVRAYIEGYLRSRPPDSLFMLFRLLENWS